MAASQGRCPPAIKYVQYICLSVLDTIDDGVGIQQPKLAKTTTVAIDVLGIDGEWQP